MSLVKLFASNLRRLRLEKMLSQEDLAEKSGLHRTYISGIERGLRNVSLNNVEKIATALGVDVVSLLANDQDATQ